MNYFAFRASALEIIAHRGASADAPENTLAAFKLGYAQEADADELDIQMSQDGRIVVLHDFDTQRIAGQPKKVEEQTFEELRQLEAGQWGRWKGSAFREKIPTLEEVLAVVPPARRLFVEIKCHNTAAETTRCRDRLLPELERILRLHPDPARRVVLITFNLEVARLAKERLPHLPVCWLYDWPTRPAAGPVPRAEDLIEKATTAHLDGLDLGFKGPIDAEFVRKAKAARLRLYVWTVDDPEVARRLAAAGVDGLTTNRPRWLRRQLGAAAGPASSDPGRP